MGYQRIRPPRVLQRYIQYFWTDDLSEYNIPGEICVNNFAEQNPRIFFLCPKDDSYLLSGDGSELPICHLKGIDTETALIRISPKASIVGACFHPFALHHIFGIHSQEISNNRVDITDLGSKKLQEMLLKAKSHRERIFVLCHFLYNQIYNRGFKKDLVSHLLVNNILKYNTSLDKITRDFNISRRHFERIFKTQTGISPAKFQSILRFEQALGTINQHANLTDVALNLNYSDQSHFIKEFKKYSGMNPKKYYQMKAIGKFESIVLEEN